MHTIELSYVVAALNKLIFFLWEIAKNQKKAFSHHRVCVCLSVLLKLLESYHSRIVNGMFAFNQQSIKVDKELSV